MDKRRPLVVEDKMYRHMFEDRLSEGDVEKARRELNEIPEIRKEALQKLQEMLAEKSDLNPCKDDIFLLRFLRLRKFNCEEALKSIKSFYKFRAQHPELFLPLAELEVAVRAGIFTLLPYRDPEGRTIFLHKIAVWSTDETSVSDYLAAVQAVAEIILDNPVTQINGYVGIMDMKDANFSHFRQFVSVRKILLLVGLVQKYFPGRVKRFFIVNCAPMFIPAYKLIKPFLKNKMLQRVVFLSAIEELYEYYNPSLLPVEYGGKIQGFTVEELVQQLRNKEDYFRRDRTFGYK